MNFQTIFGFSNGSGLPIRLGDITTKLRITVARNQKLSTKNSEFPKLIRDLHRNYFVTSLQLFEISESPYVRNPKTENSETGIYQVMRALNDQAFNLWAKQNWETLKLRSSLTRNFNYDHEILCEKPETKKSYLKSSVKI